jgi:hypothetical protein
MKKLLVSALCALSLSACGGGDGVGEGGSFETADAIYELGEQQDAEGRRVIIEVIEDTASSYLTPASPNSTWIVDRATAHTQQRPLLLNEVMPLGLYVRKCGTGAWVNANGTPFAAQSDLLQSTFDGEFVVSHFYENIQTNVLLDGDFECEAESPSFATVEIDGQEQDVQRVGKVEFAYVIQHRE